MICLSWRIKDIIFHFPSFPFWRSTCFGICAAISRITAVGATFASILQRTWVQQIDRWLRVLRNLINQLIKLRIFFDWIIGASLRSCRVYAVSLMTFTWQSWTNNFVFAGILLLSTQFWSSWISALLFYFGSSLRHEGSLSHKRRRILTFFRFVICYFLCRGIWWIQHSIDIIL